MVSSSNFFLNYLVRVLSVVIPYIKGIFPPFIKVLSKYNVNSLGIDPLVV